MHQKQPPAKIATEYSAFSKSNAFVGPGSAFAWEPPQEISNMVVRIEEPAILKTEFRRLPVPCDVVAMFLIRPGGDFNTNIFLYPWT